MTALDPRALEAATIEKCTQLVIDMMEAEKPGRAKMMLAIAAKTIRRGRHLTDAEKMTNLVRAMTEAADERW